MADVGARALAHTSRHVEQMLHQGCRARFTPVPTVWCPPSRCALVGAGLFHGWAPAAGLWFSSVHVWVGERRARRRV
eukprot:14171553-Alexandrium_andersonii.AAC.1